MNIEWTPAVVREWLDLRFMPNVLEARGNGYEVVCIECGVGLAQDECDMHEGRCSHAEDE